MTGLVVSIASGHGGAGFEQAMTREKRLVTGTPLGPASRPHRLG